MVVTLASERLIFREWTDADLAAFHRLCSDARVMEFVGDGQPWPSKTRFLQRLDGTADELLGRFQKLGFQRQQWKLCRWSPIDNQYCASI